MADHSEANDGSPTSASPQSTAMPTEDDSAAASPPAAKKTTSVKAAAEARRRRILEASNKRMGIVSGDFKGADVSADAKDGDVSEAEEGEGASAPVAKAGGGGGASRLQAMRRKRAKQRQAAAAAASSVGGAEPAGGGEPVGEGAASTDESQTVPGAPTASKGGEKEPAKEDAPAAASSNEPTEKETAEDDDGKLAAAADEAPATKKKYMGVAKMRRKMLSDKKKQEEEEGIPAPGTRPKTIPRTLSNVAKSSASRIPIFMQILTTVLLFLAGLDIGLDHSLFGDRAVELRDEDVVKFGVGPVVEGVGALKLLEPLGVGGGALPSSSAEEKERLLAERQREENVASEEHEADDEFGEAPPEPEKPAGASSTFREPNIDPIFRVDLDELTSGPGLFMVLARMAVSCHRAFLYLFLTLPMSILTSIIFLPKSLLASPPVLFLVSTAIRTFGRSVLGAHLPDAEALQQASADPAGDAEKGRKGLLEMATGAAKNAIAKNFPAAYAIFTILKDARTDMYVVLCGLLVGLALPLHLGLGDAQVGEAGKEEL